MSGMEVKVFSRITAATRLLISDLLTQSTATAPPGEVQTILLSANSQMTVVCVKQEVPMIASLSLSQNIF